VFANYHLKLSILQAELIITNDRGLLCTVGNAGYFVNKRETQHKIVWKDWLATCPFNILFYYFMLADLFSIYALR